MKKISCDGIIFDMDGVLIDVTKSYLSSIKKTVNFLLKKIGSCEKVTMDDIKALKKLPGFNDDWDTSFVLFESLKRNLLRKTFLKTAKPLPKQIRDTDKFRYLKEIFQMFYLGSALFQKIEKKKPLWENATGLIFKEKLLVPKQILKKLSKVVPLGIATGRSRAEANFTLSYFGLKSYFKPQVVVAREDAMYEKPNPASLLEAKKRLKSTHPIYVGDNISDVIAAKKAKMACIYLGLEKLGDYQLSDVRKLPEIIK